MCAELSSAMWRFMRAYAVEAVSGVSPGLCCISCMSLLVDARQTPCGCRLCGDCAEKVFSMGGRPCPGGTEDCDCDKVLDPIMDIIVDNYANREIGRLVIKCPHTDCPHANEIRKMVEHVEYCEFKEEVCTDCSQSYKKKDMDIHTKKECYMRQVKCDFCGKSFSNCQLQTVHYNIQHEDLCEKYKSSCPYLCGINQEVLIKQHLAICSNRPQPCPFTSIGCNLLYVPCQEMAEHLSVEGYTHAKSIVSYIDNLNNEIASLRRENKTQALCIERLKKEQQQKELDFERRHNDFFWKVEGYSKLLKNAKEGKSSFVKSKAFLSDRYGYKMNLKLYPNGDGVAKDNYLSLYFVFLNGKYDDILHWPFNGTVTLTLINCDGKDDHVKTGAFKNLSRESHVGAGCIKFIEISKALESRFSKNDNLYIKCSIH